MVFGKPVAVVPECIGSAGKRERFLDRAARVVTADDGGLIGDREFHLPIPSGTPDRKDACGSRAFAWICDDPSSRSDAFGTVRLVIVSPTCRQCADRTRERLLGTLIAGA